MEIAKGIAALTIPLGIVYLFLGLFAYKYAEDKVMGVYPWWAFHPSNFNEAGKKLCRVGRFIGYVVVVLSVAYLVIVVGGI